MTSSLERVIRCAPCDITNADEIRVRAIITSL